LISLQNRYWEVCLENIRDVIMGYRHTNTLKQLDKSTSSSEECVGKEEQILEADKYIPKKLDEDQGKQQIVKCIITVTVQKVHGQL
jgi:hypothetical protein